jgi:uncharacterized damage-inducible protein DinB
MTNGVHTTRTELEDYRDHLERCRAVTLAVLDAVPDEHLSWRPAPDLFTVGQQLVHIAQAEDRYIHGLFTGDWDYERVRLPKPVPPRAQIRTLYEDVRQRTRSHLEGLSDERFGDVIEVPDAPVSWSLRAWLWFILEHELLHRGQLVQYLRALGVEPPFYAMVLEGGARPDISARAALGGV